MALFSMSSFILFTQLYGLNLFGFKGLDKAGKVSVQAAKQGAQKAGQRLDELLPYHPKHQLAMDGPVPYNVYDGVNLRDQLIVKVENVTRQEKGMKSGDKIYGKDTDNPAHNAAQFDKLKTHNQQVEKYGKAGVRELSDGRIRYYGDITPASKAGEMAGRRVVREWNPSTGLKRTWHETVDHNGVIRQVRPDVKFTGGSKVHYRFDSSGSYIGKW